MYVPRRRFLRLAAFAAVLPAMSRLAQAQTYPARPVRFVVGFAPGGPNDILARLIGEWLTGRLGQPFAVENLPGGSSNPATEVVVRAPPDGHTILLMGPANAIMRRCSPISASTSAATLRRSPASPARRWFWSCILRCRRRPFRS